MASEATGGDPSIRLDFWEDMDGTDSILQEIGDNDNDQLFDEYRDMMIKSTVPIEAIIMHRIVIKEHCRFKVKEPRISKADIRREKAGNIPKSKTPYSVFEDMVILSTFNDAQNSGISMNEKIDLVMEDLPARSFESLRERYRKWLKDLTEEEVESINKFCDENYENCEICMIKKRIDVGQKCSVLDSFIPIPRKGGNMIAADVQKEVDISKLDLINLDYLAAQSPDKSDLRSKIKKRLESMANSQSSCKIKASQEIDREIPMPDHHGLSNLEVLVNKKLFEKRIHNLERLQYSASKAEPFAMSPVTEANKLRPPPLKISFSEKLTVKSKNIDEESMIENESPARLDFTRQSSIVDASPISRWSVGNNLRKHDQKDGKNDDYEFKRKSDLFKSPTNLFSRRKPQIAELNDNTSEEASLYLSKRNPSEILNGIGIDLPDSDQVLKRKAELFKRSIREGRECVKENSMTLLKLLKFMAHYHEVDVKQIISQLDENKDLDISKLRLKLCNQTAVKHILGPKLIRL